MCLTIFNTQCVINCCVVSQCVIYLQNDNNDMTQCNKHITISKDKKIKEHDKNFRNKKAH